MPTSALLQRPQPAELAQLFRVVGWGETNTDVLAQSIAAYPCTVCARTEFGQLVGYLSAFSDEVLSTLLGELVVHPQWRRQGLAASMLRTVEQRYPNAPIYVKALGDSKYFYEAVGFKAPKAEFTVMFKHPIAAQLSHKAPDPTPSEA